MFGCVEISFYEVIRAENIVQIDIRNVGAKSWAKVEVEIPRSGAH